MADGPDLQFDTAEYSAPATCATCGAPIAGPHFRIGTDSVCPPCRARVDEALVTTPEALGRAVGYGVAAAAAAALGWMVLRDQIGDIRIAVFPVAWVVTWAIRWAAGGGTAQQVLAVTYTAGAAAVYVATGPEASWREPSSALLWLVVVGVALLSAWSRTAPTRLPFEAVS